MVVKSLEKVKDEEISLEDVRRAEEIIRRANALLGRKDSCSHYHYGWTWTTQPYLTTGATNLHTVTTNNTKLLTTSIVDAGKLCQPLV